MTTQNFLPEKRSVSTSLTAFYHWLFSILISNLISVSIVFFTAPYLGYSSIYVLIVVSISLPLAISLASIGSAKFIQKIILVKDSERIVRLSTIYMIVVSGYVNPVDNFLGVVFCDWWLSFFTFDTIL